MRRLSKSFIGLGALALLSLGYSLLPRVDDLKSRFENEASALLQNKLTVQSAQFSYFPPALTLQNLSIGENLQAKSARVDIGFSGLFSRHLSGFPVHFSGVNLQSFSLNESALAQFNTLMRLDNSPMFGLVTFDKARFQVKAFDKNYDFDGVKGLLDFQNTHSPLRFTLENALHSIDLSLNNPADFIARKATPLQLKYRYDAISNDIKGVVSQQKQLQFTGDLVLTAPFTKGVAKVSSQNNQLNISEIKFEAAAHKMTGELRYLYDIDSLNGKFELDKFSYNFGDFAATGDAKSGDTRDKINPRFIKTVNLDLAIKEASLNGYVFQNNRMKVESYDGVVHAKLLEASGYKGNFKGEVMAENNVIKADISGEDVDILTFMPQLNVTGRGQMRVQSQFQYPNIIPQQMSFQLNMGEGAFQKGNLEDTFKDVLRRPLARSGAVLRGGLSPFQSLQGGFELKAGVIHTTSDIKIIHSQYSAHLSGKSQISGKGLDFNGVAHLNGEKIDLPFKITGSYAEPSLRFDVLQLIKQSRAAAPLRSPARDEEAARVVREIITRSNPELVKPE